MRSEDSRTRASRRWRAARLLFVPLVGLLVLGVLFSLPPSRAWVRGEELATVRVLDRHGRVLREVPSSECGVAHRVPLERMSPWVVEAFVAAEDKRFWRHPGIDPVALARALFINVRAGRVVSGGSTITQQLCRSLHPGRRRGIGTKLAEAFEALWLERHLSKREIIEAYLNRVGFGNRSYGIAAAARFYFGCDPARLSLAQSCFLAALPRAPAFYDPLRNPGRATARQRRILDRLLELGRVEEPEHSAALAESVGPVAHRTGFEAPHFVDLVLAKPGRGRGRPTEIRTTLDLALQHRCEALLERQLDRLAGHHCTNGAVVVLDRASGDVLAMVGSADWWSADAGQVNACLSPRQTGSAVKPFAYALAFENGMTAATVLPDLPHHFDEDGGDYRPVNFDRGFHGPVTCRTALACSYNIPAVRVVETVGPDRLLGLLRRCGVTTLNEDAGHYGLALALGVGDLPLIELANAYRVLANGGRFARARTRLDEPVDPGTSVLSEPACWLVTDILCDNDARAAAFGEFSCLNLGPGVAVKTGTSKDFRDNWAVGYTSRHVVGVWAGNFDGSPMHRVSGVTGAGVLFRDIALALGTDQGRGFPAPGGIVDLSVCPVSGLLPGPDCPNARTEHFIRGTEPRDTCQVHRAVLVDRATGQPVAPGRPGVRRVVEVLPPEYGSWLDRGGISQPVAAGPVAAGPAVLFPDPGDVFKLDPDLARESQALRLQAVLPAGSNEATWEMDGAELCRVGPPWSTFWNLEPGRHRVRVSSDKGASEEISFLVLP